MLRQLVIRRLLKGIYDYAYKGGKLTNIVKARLLLANKLLKG